VLDIPKISMITGY